MKSQSTLLIILLYWLLPQGGTAQPINHTFGDVTLPSYSVASHGKFGEVPVSYFTGVPSIGVDIYEVKQGPLSLPISVNYHASGLRLSEIASWVGAGWALNAGVMRSRTVVGIPDEKINGWFSKSGLSGIGFQEVVEGTEDSEPDMFQFNVLGYSGRYVGDLPVFSHFRANSLLDTY